jgi:hypothetical protein
MIRLSLRQFRTQGWLAVGLLLVTAVLLASSGPHLAQLYAEYAKSQTACPAFGPCLRSNLKISQIDRLLELFGTALVAIPGLIGAFWGAPLTGRELERGTHRLAWTQSVSRTRWLTVKVALVGAASIAATGVLSLMVTWWSSPIDHMSMNRFGSGQFGERNITPIGYAAFAFALGVTAGLVIRRTVPAMAATLAAFLAVRLAFTYLIRQHLLAPAHITQPLAAVVQGYGQTNNSPPTLFTGATFPNSWVYSTRIVDNDGHALAPRIVADSCPALQRPFSGGAALHDCIAKLSVTYHGIVTYQPASRYWPLQCYETGIFVAAAAALVALSTYLVRHRSY